MARKKYVADLETTTDPLDCRVWGWGFINIDDTSRFRIGSNFDELMKFFIDTKNIDVYFHNLRFDGSFVVNWLFQNGWKFSREKRPLTKTFSTSISKANQWYMIDITTGYKPNGERIHTVIYDSLKKLPFSVKDIANAFKLPMLKGEIDYNEYRPIGHKLTEKEIAYIKNDIEIVALALKELFNQNLTGITIGQDALSDFKNRISRKAFNKFFPQLSFELDAELRTSYKGGFTWVNPVFQGKTINSGLVYDVNSLYPSVMYNEWLPFGTPRYFKGKYRKDKNFPLYIQRLKCEFMLKEKHIPTIQIKGSRFTENEYLTTSENEQVTLTMTSVDLNLMFDHYEVYNIEYIEGWKFNAQRGFFDDYIEHWNKVKIKNVDNPPLYNIAKLMLNNLYGKFGKNPDVTPKLPSLDKHEKVLKLKTPKDNEGNEITEFGDTVYIPLGSFITAYARNKTIRTAQKVFDRIIYCDTDSIHITENNVPESITNEIHDTELGKWKLECEFIKAKFIRQKTYVEFYYKKGKLVEQYKCAGMPDRIKQKLTFDTFKIGFHSPTGKLVPKQVKNGTVLIDRPYTLK